MLEIVNIAAAIGTFLVIAATAIAAVIQLRHMRANNQLVRCECLICWECAGRSASKEVGR